MRSFSDLIESFGAPALAELLHLEESHIRTMKARDSIPPEHWGPIIEDAARRKIPGVNWKSLRALRNSRFSPRERRREAVS